MQGTGRDLEALEDLVTRAAPDGVLVLYRNVSAVSGDVEGVDDPVPVELSSAGYAVGPPAGVRGRSTSNCLPEDSMSRACPFVDLDVLGQRDVRPMKVVTCLTPRSAAASMQARRCWWTRSRSVPLPGRSLWPTLPTQSG